MHVIAGKLNNLGIKLIKLLSMSLISIILFFILILFWSWVTSSELNLSFNEAFKLTCNSILNGFLSGIGVRLK